MTTVQTRLSVALAGAAATALLAAAPCLASPNTGKKGSTKPDKPATYYVVTLENTYVSH
jgi:hypothetical protein